MMTVDEALAMVLDLAPPPRTEVVPLAQAAGRVLAAAAVARLTQPPFDAAAMDGYAVRAEDGDGPFEVIGESAAGRPWHGTPRPGAAIRIFTGAAVPMGYDCVVMQENVERDGNLVSIVTRSGNANIRPAGNDFREGDVIEAGIRLRSPEIGLLAAMNIPEVTVAARPRVAILAGGDELVPPGATPAEGQIISSNDLAIAALVAEAGGEAQMLAIARDTEDSLREGFLAAGDADLIVTIGGASVGDHDLVGQVAAQLGMAPSFHRIAMRPGKPLMAGKLGSAPVIGLPGNPVSAIVCGILFMQPLIRRMQGLDGSPTPLLARLASPVPAEGNRQHYQRAKLEPGEDLPLIEPFADQDSSRLMLLTQADALLIRPANDKARRAGEAVSYIPLGRN